MDALFSNTIERMFATLSTPQQVRTIEQGGSPASLWREIHESGFADALVPEAQGGAGVRLADVFEVLLACGSHALPVPLALTMLVRAALAEAGQSVPEGPITIATTVVKTHDDTLECPRVAYARVSEWALVKLHGACALLAIGSANVTPTEVHGSLEGNLRWTSRPSESASFASTLDWQAAGACLFATHLAGAMERILTSTVRYANERSQFGQSIGKFQAVQQQISVMAEQVFAARIAAQIGCASVTYVPDPLRAAVAKAQPVSPDYLMAHQEYSPTTQIQGVGPYLRAASVGGPDGRP